MTLTMELEEAAADQIEQVTNPIRNRDPGPTRSEPIREEGACPLTPRADRKQVTGAACDPDGLILEAKDGHGWQLIA